MRRQQSKKQRVVKAPAKPAELWSLCEPCGKRAYPTPAAAVATAARNIRFARDLRVFECIRSDPVCWHLTKRLRPMRRK